MEKEPLNQTLINKSPSFVIEIATKKKVDIEKATKQLPREVSDKLISVSQANGRIKAEFRVEVLTMPRYQNQTVKTQRFMDISGFQFETFIYPYFKRIFRHIGEISTEVEFALTGVNHLYVFPKVPIPMRDREKMNILGASAYRYTFPLTSTAEQRVKKEWNQFVQSIEKQGGLPKNTIFLSQE